MDLLSILFDFYVYTYSCENISEKIAVALENNCSLQSINIVRVMPDFQLST